MQKKQYKINYNKPKPRQSVNVNELELSKELNSLQGLMPISNEDRNRLKEQIISCGEIRDPIKIYFGNKNKGQILCGKNRWEIACELNWNLVPVEIYENLTKKQRDEIVIMDNLARRHFTTKQKSIIVEHILKKEPAKTNRSIARLIGVDHKTVSKKRQDLETVGEIPQLKTLKGTDGKEYKAIRRNDLKKIIPKSENSLKSINIEDIKITEVMNSWQQILQAADSSNHLTLKEIIKISEMNLRELNKKNMGF